ncbi:WD_REPEATS_REGION domain-containing protein, partial [Haematococcus lacustris]
MKAAGPSPAPPALPPSEVQLGSQRAAAQKLAALEAALKRATEDYQLLLQELRTIREEAVARDVTQRQLREERDALQRQLLSHGAREGAAAGELAMLRTEVARLERQLRDAEMRIGQLTRALSDCEAHRKRWEELEGTHSTVKQRLEAARLSDELALEAELSALRDDHAKAVQQRDAAQHQGEQLRGDKARLDAELEGARGQVAALEGDKDGLGAQLKAALAAA